VRTTPARKPRTECCCQPVAFIIASIVAPAGDRSIAMTCDSLEPDFPCSDLRSFWLSCAAFAAVVAEVDATVRFLADFDIENLHPVGGGDGLFLSGSLGDTDHAGAFVPKVLHDVIAQREF
jgi:hypothetical protein